MHDRALTTFSKVKVVKYSAKVALVCERDAGANAVDGGYLWRLMWILWMTSSLITFYECYSLSFRTFTLSNTAVSSPQCNSEKRPFSNSAALRTLFK